MRIGARLAVAFCGLALAACGYHLVRSDEPLGDLRSIAIETLRNDSVEPGLEFVVADALHREFLRRGALRVVDDPARADVVLSGSVLPVLVQGRSFSSVVLALEYQVTLRLALEAKRADGVELALDPVALTETELYLASADIEAQRKNREEALRRIAGVLAVRVHEALYERFAP